MDNVPQTWQQSFQLGMSYAIAQFSSFFPRLISAVLILFVGILLAKIIKKAVFKTLETFHISKIVDKTPLELFFSDAGFGAKLEELISGIVYWAVVFLVFYTSVSILGLTPLTLVMDGILAYIPHIISAFLIFFFGVLMAGIVESMIKGSLRTFDVSTVRLIAKLASYVVVSVGCVAAVAELGIASEFLTILFGGVVFALSLGMGLAIGLGGQDTVRNVLADWYKRAQPEKEVAEVVKHTPAKH